MHFARKQRLMVDWINHGNPLHEIFTSAQAWASSIDVHVHVYLTVVNADVCFQIIYSNSIQKSE